MSLAAILAASSPLVDGFASEVPDEWLQGRTAYGGFSAALALAAAQQVGGDDLPPLRSAAVSFVGPLYGAIEVRARVLRRGKNATWIAAEITRDGEVGFTVTFVFMAARDSALHLNDLPAPTGWIAPEAAEPFNFYALTPAFLCNNFEVRFALPKSEEKRPELCWWLRAKEYAALDPMMVVMLIADGLPPGILPMLNARVPVSSMTWQANLLTSNPQTRDGWFMLRSTGDYAENGCSSQRMGVWNADGVAVLAGMQSVAVFG